MRIVSVLTVAFVLGGTTVATAQAHDGDVMPPGPAAQQGLDEWTPAGLMQQAVGLHQQAIASHGGSASITMTTYPGHHTMLTVRTKSGGAEMHAHAADVFVVIDGEATEYTGGTIENAKVSSAGETRGSAVVGGTPHVMRKGDIVHIAPNTPHQTVLAPGATFTYYVIKIDQP